ncbi:MAG: DUF1697 domain-containing protein [Lacrimispora sp.]|uniref:DUF1697 domain-containing protein n=1 Tax=Lacrimispora sp. TaxID=2719234 RepID=UPI0039E30944
MKYTALFRGINVGGKNIVKMENLRQLFLDLGVSKVKTYIQSGNVVFETDLEETYLQGAIHTGFAERFGFESHVILRDINEIETLITQIPITPDEIAAAEAADPKVEHLYVCFLDIAPEQSQIDSICREYVGKDMLLAGEKELYLLCYESIRNSKMAVYIGKSFPVSTMRNWKTVNKLYGMMTDL